MITTTFKNWTELDFCNCSIGEIECEHLYNYLKITDECSTVKLLKIHSKNLPTSIIPKLILKWMVQELAFCGIFMNTSLQESWKLVPL